MNPLHASSSASSAASAAKAVKPTTTDADVCSNHSHCSQLRCNNAPVQAMQGGIERSCERLEARRLRGM
jgi:hypothetical protein